jgi:CofD-related protein of GAK system
VSVTIARITRSVQVPDPVLLARRRRIPELGPRILFFSGGSAIRGVATRLIHYTHNSIHLITPFDSGGSSAVIRRAFNMLAVGDLRNRLMALADHSVRGNPDVFRLFAYRFSRREAPVDLNVRLRAMVDGEDELVAPIPEPTQQIIRSHLEFFQTHVPADFDLRGANVGNLILAGGFLNQNRHFAPVGFLFTQMVGARGIVSPVTEESLHLAARLQDGRTIIGQHLLTGKETAPLTSRIEDVWLVRGPDDPTEVQPVISDTIRRLIRQADLICFPMGSFYSSLIAPLLPVGVGEAIAETDVPKVFIPNAGADPEQIGTSLVDRVQLLARYLRRGHAADRPLTDLVQHVLIDAAQCRSEQESVRQIRELGLQIIACPLVSQTTGPMLDDDRIVQALVSMA